MANNNSYEKFYVANKRLLNETETNLECSVSLESDEQVKKILAVDISGNIQNTESLQGEANASGNLFVSVLYATESGLVGNASYSSPFVAKITDGTLKPNSKVFAKVASCDAVVGSITSNVAKIDCVAKIGAFCYQNDEVTYLSQVDDDVCFLQESEEYFSYKNTIKSCFTESLESVIKESVQKVLSSCTTASLKSFECGSGFVSLNYEIVNKITYLDMQENSQIKSVYSKQDFVQQIECQDVNPESKVEVNLFVEKQNENTNISEGENEVKIVNEIPLCAFVSVFDKNVVNTITDLYSTKNSTNTSTISYTKTQVCEPIVFEKKIEGSLSLSDDEPRIDKLLAVTYSKVTVTNNYLTGGEFSASGVITSNLIYFNEDDIMPCSVDVEVPFVVTTQTELDGEYIVDLSVTAKDVDVMVKKGREVFVDATLCVFANVCNTKQEAVISELVYKEEIMPKDCAIEIYFGKAGQSVWEIAKSLNIKPEKIYSQNPNISERLENDEKLAIYYQKTKN